MIILTEDAAEGSKALSESVSRKRLINMLNHVNFRGGDVVVNLRRLRDGSRLSLRARPEPCSGDTAHLAWSETPPGNIATAPYELADFFIDRGSRVIIVEGKLTDVSRLGIAILLPDHCYATSRRRLERYSAAQVRATLSRNGSETTGLLQDFGGECLKVRFAAGDAGFLLKGRGAQPLQVSLMSGGAIVYTGKGLVKRHITNGENVDLVVALAAFSEEERTAGQEVTLGRPLVATCRHPLSDRLVRFQLTKASYNSFVVSEHPEHAVLFPGLIIPEMQIDFGAGVSVECTAQVAGGEAGEWLVSIIDMPIRAQRKLFSFIEKETGMVSAVSGRIDPEELIEFFFEAGFIYPEKYAGVAHSQECFREMLSRLYIDAPSISQHFVRYNRGLIEAHVSMVRFYERAWVIHHHAALGQNGAGSAVLAQVFRYIYSYSALSSTGMDYLLCYYRPENRFPNRVLGGFARLLGNPGLCSVDPFAYLHHRFEGSGGEARADEEWQLAPASREDRLALEACYAGISGGLTLKAFGLEASAQGRETADLDAEFEKAGLCRRKSLFSLRNEGRLKAVMMALDSDAGLNMSNLMKCIHVFVIDKEDLPFDQLMHQLDRLSSLYEEREIPVLLFPSSYVMDQGVSLEKVYDLLVFDASIVKQFVEFMERLTNRAVRKRRGVLTLDQKGEASGQR